MVTRGKYGERLVETIRDKTDFEIETAGVPEFLPDFIEDPQEFRDELNLDPKIFRVNLLITYSLHPDLTPEIVRRAGIGGVKVVIIPGGISRAGSLDELQKIADIFGIYIEVDEICCTLDKSGIPELDLFTEKLGRPEIAVDVKDGRISDVVVKRGSPCGSTWFMAKEIIGKTLDEAPAWAGLYCQQYPCRAVRGTPGGIHTSGDLHKYAMERALGQKTQLKIADKSLPIKIIGKK